MGKDVNFAKNTHDKRSKNSNICVKADVSVPTLPSRKPYKTTVNY